jgi:hypothetical protein
VRFSEGRRARSGATNLVMVLTVVLGTLMGVATPGLASAAPVTQCGYGSSAGNTRTCVTLGSTTVSTSATVISTGRTLRSCLRRNGSRLVCTAYGYIRPGGGTGNTWVAGGQVPSGTYCAVTWRLYADGAQAKVGTVCVGVGTTVIT